MRILLTGASGQLGAYLVDRIVGDGRHELIAWSGREAGRRAGVAFEPVDLASPDGPGAALDRADPDAVLHAAAISAAAVAHRDPSRARAVNAEATRRLADWCGRRGRRLVFTSTDLVFDGSRPWSREDDPPRPVMAYGRTKCEAEPAVLGVERGLVARLSLLYGPSRNGRASFFGDAIAALRRGEPRAFFEDEYRTPLDLATAAEALVGLLESGATGLVHVAGSERMSRYEHMRRLASALGLDPGLVRANRRADAPGPEPRPADVSLETSRLRALLPGLRRPGIEGAGREMRGEFGA